MKRSRRNHSSAFKAKVALAAMKGDQTLAQLSERFDVHAQQITQWKAQLLERAGDVFATAAEKRGSDGPSLKDLHWRWRTNGMDIPLWKSAPVDVTIGTPFIFERGDQMNEVRGVVTVLGIDLAKRVFALHGVDRDGKVVLKQVVSRSTLPRLIAQLPPCLIGMEACSGAHEWARQFAQHGHTVKLMAPVFVTAYRKAGKNDDNDADAICEAAGRPNMRFVPVKTRAQQALLALHRVRQGFVEQYLRAAVSFNRKPPQRRAGCSVAHSH